MADVAGYLPLEHYGVIGDSRTMALVSKAGSIDWLCLPRFDSPSLFNRLLDQQRGGYFSVSPAEPYASHQWYHQASAVLVTEFATEQAVVRVTDAMPAISEAGKRGAPQPFRSVARD